MSENTFTLNRFKTGEVGWSVTVAQDCTEADIAALVRHAAYADELALEVYCPPKPPPEVEKQERSELTLNQPKIV